MSFCKEFINVLSVTRDFLPLKLEAGQYFTVRSIVSKISLSFFFLFSGGYWRKGLGTRRGEREGGQGKNVINDEAVDDNDDDNDDGDSDQGGEPWAHHQCCRSPHSKCLNISTFPCFISNDQMTFCMTYHKGPQTISQLWSI